MNRAPYSLLLQNSQIDWLTNSAAQPPSTRASPAASTSGDVTSDLDSSSSTQNDYRTRGTAAGYSRPTLERDVELACRECFNLHLALGCVPYDQLATMVETGKIKDTFLTKKMVLSAAARLPPCDRCAHGKSTSYPLHPSAHDPAVASVLDPDGGAHTLRIDIMFTRSKTKAKAPCLVVTDEVTGHTNIIYLPSRKTKHVEAALRKAIAFLEKHGIKVGLIKSDREGAFVELNSQKFRFQLTAGPGTHESVSERVIKTLKEMFVCKREGLSFTLPRSLYPRLMEHVCVLYNHRLKAGATATPAELVTGRNITANDLVQGAFGRIGLFHIPDEEARKRKLDDLDRRSEYGVVIGFEPSNPRNLKVYLPAHKQIVTRRAGKPVGDPKPAIDAMNKLAAEEEATYNRSSTRLSVSDDETSPTTLSPTDDQADPDQDDEIYTVYGLYAKTETLPQLPTVISANAAPTSKKTAAKPSTRPILLDPSDTQLYHIPTGAFERISIKKARQCLPTKLVDDAVITELITNMQKYHVWDYCSPGSLKGKHILRSMLFLKVKTKPDGTFDKLKGRLVPDGSMQTTEEYHRTSSPTVDFSNLALLLSLTKYLHADITTADVPAAYHVRCQSQDRDVSLATCTHPHTNTPPPPPHTHTHTHSLNIKGSILLPLFLPY
jgi:hypothetical protein